MNAIEQIRATVRASEWSIFGSSAEIRAGAKADETIRIRAHDWLTALLDVAETAQVLVNTSWANGDGNAMVADGSAFAALAVALGELPQDHREGE